ncbi:MAG: hypothetical protein KF845_02875 [Cyclobacteriaceae bacterium]|nr:hypothetical protein [Cyclobacteriaceae bacterium]
MVKGLKFIAFWACVATLAGCSMSNDNIRVFSYSFEFSNSDGGWYGDFADYPEDDSVFYELKFKRDTVPGTKGARKGLMLSGNNRNHDLFMFVRNKLTGLKPNTTYRVLFNVRFASKENTSAIGASKTPGEIVFVKAGAMRERPEKILEEGMYRMNVDVGSLALAGNDVLTLGHIGVATTTTAFTEVYRNNNSSNSFLITTNHVGEVWVLVGTDSGYEGVTTIYYTAIDIFFNEVE